MPSYYTTQHLFFGPAQQFRQIQNISATWQALSPAASGSSIAFPWGSSNNAFNHDPIVAAHWGLIWTPSTSNQKARLTHHFDYAPIDFVDENSNPVEIVAAPTGGPIGQGAWVTHQLNVLRQGVKDTYIVLRFFGDGNPVEIFKSELVITWQRS